ncbi:MAG: class I SAM-dependent methyltransferase [Methanocorpusculum sp.]|nr:class I SAM-dependent methyltransferase [Methanocorpusculum sp.]
MNKEQEKINEIWTNGASNYNKIIDSEIESFRAEEWCRQILDNAPWKDCLKILDCGCGPGFFSVILARKGHTVHAIDASDGMMNFAKKRAERYGLNIEFAIMDCHKLEYNDDTFDLIVSRNVTHALREHRIVYREWKRVLKPGGVLLIFDANWHLASPGGPEHEESNRRYVECMKTYGSDFSGNVYDGDESKLIRSIKKTDAYTEEEFWKTTLKDKRRPDWDLGLLEGIEFGKITYDRDIIEKLWDDKEKLIYGNTPMFMIRAVKARN